MKQYIKSNCVMDSGVFYMNQSKPSFLFLTEQINLMFQSNNRLIKRPPAKHLGKFPVIKNGTRCRLLMFPLGETKIIFVLLTDIIDPSSKKIKDISLRVYSYCFDKHEMQQIIFENDFTGYYIDCESMNDLGFFTEKDQIYFYRKSGIYNSIRYEENAPFLDEFSPFIKRLIEEPVIIPKTEFEKLSMSMYRVSHLRVIHDLKQL